MRHLALAVLTVVLVAGCGSGGGGSSEATVDLSAQNGSNESGTATLTADGDKTKVVISLDGAPAEAQPAHIHKGSCSNLDPTPAYGLQNIVDGKSTTEVDEPLKELEGEDYAINVHKSAADLKTYVACGDIGSGSSSGSDTGTNGGYGY